MGYIMIRNSKVIMLLSLSLFSSFLVAVENIDIVPNSELLKWGYETKGTLKREQSLWEKETFGQAQIYTQKIRSINELKSWKGAHYRFTLAHEVYSLDSFAENRIKNIRLHPPGVNTKMEPEYVLRSAFRVNNGVYLITTDVVKFELEMMSKIESLLKKYVNKNP